MALSALRASILGIINDVQKMLGVDPTSTLTSTKMATNLLRYLNEVIDECSDYGDWQELYTEVSIATQSSVGEYEIQTSGATILKNIVEIRYGDQISPLNVVELQDIRRLQRLSSFGTPRNFAVVGVDASSGNPHIRLHPIPITVTSLDIAAFEKPRLYTTADVSAVPVFPANMLIKGVYAKAVLEENGGEPTREYETAYAEYIRMRAEAQRRFNADTGTDMQIVPR